jgi:hypothetical protein
MVSQASFKSFITAVATSLNHGLRKTARVPAAPVKASLLEGVMVVEGNRLGKPYRSGCTLPLEGSPPSPQSGSGQNQRRQGEPACQ